MFDVFTITETRKHNSFLFAVKDRRVDLKHYFLLCIWSLFLSLFICIYVHTYIYIQTFRVLQCIYGLSVSNFHAFIHSFIHPPPPLSLSLYLSLSLCLCLPTYLPLSLPLPLPFSLPLDKDMFYILKVAEHLRLPSDCLYCYTGC